MFRENCKQNARHSKDPGRSRQAEVNHVRCCRGRARIDHRVVWSNEIDHYDEEASGNQSPADGRALMDSCQKWVSFSALIGRELSVLENMEVDWYHHDALCDRLQMCPWLGNEVDQVKITLVEVANLQVVVPSHRHI